MSTHTENIRLKFVTLCFQNFLRCQNNKANYNLVCETLQFLDIMCGSTTGGLGLLGLYINESNVHLIIQTLETLTEYCQGPCQENQVHENNRVEIMVSTFLWQYRCQGGAAVGSNLQLEVECSRSACVDFLPPIVHRHAC